MTGTLAAVGAGLAVIGQDLVSADRGSQWMQCQTAEAYSKIQLAMIISAALIEGVAFCICSY